MQNLLLEFFCRRYLQLVDLICQKHKSSQPLYGQKLT